MTATTDRISDHRDRVSLLVLAAFSYLPMLWTSPGRVSADTKSYLTIDPSDLLGKAVSMWDPSVGAGTVTHQTLGYLFPLGPYYWFMETVGVPDWLTQRLLWGTIVFAAATGAWRLARMLGYSAAAALVVGVAYGFTPYLLSYLARLSIILFPWAALGWLVLFAARAAREPGWRWPARFALVVAVVGSVNATSLVFVGLAPVLWLVLDAASRRVDWKHAIAAALRIGGLCIGVSIWWILGLRIQGTYGLPVLDYTETYEAVASSSTPFEILRGLGYWFFYGGDQVGPWIGPAGPYVSQPLLIALGALLAGLGLTGLLVRAQRAGSMTMLLLVGLTVSVGAAPLGRSSLWGSLFESTTDSAVGLALRSTPRAAPLVVLALAFGLGALVERPWPARSNRLLRLPAMGQPVVAAGIVVLLMVQLWPWWTGQALTDSLLRDEQLPDHRVELAEWLDDNGSSRVYELPGADFAYYRWGGTIDPVLPGMIDRPTLARELVPQGGFGTAELVNALERRIYEGWFEPESLAPVMDRLGVGTIAVRNDIEHERFRLARPGPLWDDLLAATGSAEPAFAGPTATDTPVIPFTDELTLAHIGSSERFPVVAAFDLDADRPLADTLRSAEPIIVAGDADAIIDLAASGLLGVDDRSRPIIYDSTALSNDVTSEASWVVISDTNRRQGLRWSTIGSNGGYVETPGEQPLEDDPSDSRLPTQADDDALRTTAAFIGAVARVQATNYGNRISFTPEDAPHFALDGDPLTAWRGGVFQPTDGLRLEVDLVEPVVASEITLLQPQTGSRARSITDVDIAVDGSAPLRVSLDDRSREQPGQTVALPAEAADGFERLTVTVRRDDAGPVANYAGRPGVGFAEVMIPGVDFERTLVMPEASSGDIPSRTTVMMTRERIDPATPNRSDPEPALDRTFTIPALAAAEWKIEARISGTASDDVLGSVLTTSANGWTATANRRSPGSPTMRAAAVLDDDPTTAWTTPLDDTVGSVLTLTSFAPRTIDGLDVSWREGAAYSRPTALVVRSDAGDTRDVELTAEPVRFAPMTGTSFDIEVAAIDERVTASYFSGVTQVLPVAFESLRFVDSDDSTPGGVELDSDCRSDVLLLDGAPIPVRLSGDASLAVDRGELSLELCDPAAHASLSAGTHRLRVAPGHLTGIDVDRVTIDTGPALSKGPVLPASTVDRESATSVSVEVEASAEPLWFVWRESLNDGWKAVVTTETGDTLDLGRPTLIDGYANGWLLPPSAASRTIELTWTPQRSIRFGLVISMLSGLAALALAVLRRGPAPSLHGRVEIVVLDNARATGVSPETVTALQAPAGPVALAAVVVALAIAGGPLAGVGAAVVMLPARWIPARWFPGSPAATQRAIAVVVLAGGFTTAYIAGLQFLRDYISGPDWPLRFDAVAGLTWACVAAVAAAVLADRREH